jgi:hypothetical protein
VLRQPLPVCSEAREQRFGVPHLQSARVTLSTSAVWCGVVWCGVVWCGVVWCGVVWCGVVWCGVVQRSAAQCSVV